MAIVWYWTSAEWAAVTKDCPNTCQRDPKLVDSHRILGKLLTFQDKLLLGPGSLVMFFSLAADAAQYSHITAIIFDWCLDKYFQSPFKASNCLNS